MASPVLRGVGAGVFAVPVTTAATVQLGSPGLLVAVLAVACLAAVGWLID